MTGFVLPAFITFMLIVINIGLAAAYYVQERGQKEMMARTPPATTPCTVQTRSPKPMIISMVPLPNPV